MPHQILDSKTKDLAGNPAITVPWKVSDVAMATVMVIAGFLTIFVVLQILTHMTNLETRIDLAPWFISASEGLMILAVWIFAIKKYRIRWQILGLTTPSNITHFGLPIMAVVVSLAFTGVYVTIVNFIGIDTLMPSPLPAEVLGNGMSRVLNVTAIVLWGPFAEELFFRGFFLVSLIPLLGSLRASIVSSAAFAIVHLSLGTIIPIFITGLIFSWLYLKTRSLWHPIAAHATQNFISISVAL